MGAGGLAAWTALLLCCFAVIILPFWSYLLYNDLSSFELPISVSKQDAATSCLVAAVIYSVVGVGCVIFMLSDYVFTARGGRTSVGDSYRRGYSSGHHRQVEMKPLLDDHNDMSDAGSRTSSQTMSSHEYSGDPFDNPSPLGVSKEETDSSHTAFLSYKSLGNAEGQRLTRNHRPHPYTSVRRRELSPIAQEVTLLDLLSDDPFRSSPPHHCKHATVRQSPDNVQTPVDHDLLAARATTEFPDVTMFSAAPTLSTPPVVTPQEPTEALTSKAVLYGRSSSPWFVNSPPAPPIDNSQGSSDIVSCNGADHYTARLPQVSFRDMPNALSSPLLLAPDTQSLDLPRPAALRKVPSYRKAWETNTFLKAQA